MSELLQEISDRLTYISAPVLLMSDPDGLLSAEAVRNKLSTLIGMPVVEAAGLQLRVHYELNIRRNPDARVCYICKSPHRVLWDIERHSRTVKISVAELFPNFVDRETLASLDFATLDKIFSKHIQGRVSASRLQQLLSDATLVAEPIVESATDALSRLADVPDWSDTEYVEKLGKTLKQIFAERSYGAEVVEKVNNLNFDFQHHLQDCYFATLNSAGGPKAVHAVAPWMQQRFGTGDKLAFIVVDGMAWWQWEVLRDELEKRKLISLPKVKAIFAWLPSITALSRQALFRGAIPMIDYRQTPAEEEKLWKKMWVANPMFAPVYQHNIQSADQLNTATRRLAVVDVHLDKKMHQSSDYYDLHDLTRNWAVKFADIIARLRKEGFKIVLTTDHGNVLAKGIGTLNAEDKAHLYLANSRGERFVYFNSKELKNSFRVRNYMTPFFSNPRENWLAIANDSSFSTVNKQLITHGGSHFMETVIPLIIF